MTKVRPPVDAKSVKLVIVGVELPCGILFPLPETEIETVGTTAAVNPLTTPPGVIQLDVVPELAILFRVPFSEFPLASVKDVTVFVPKAIPWLK